MKLDNITQSLVALFFVLGFASCTDQDFDKLPVTTYGQEKNFGMGKTRTYVTISPEGEPSELGLIITEDAFKGLALASGDLYISLDFPKEAEKTPFKHQFLGYAPHGHEPIMVYGSPHFDLHYYTTTNAEREAITPFDTVKASIMPKPEFFPAAYFPTGLVPQMGVHWIDGTSPELAGAKFTETFIWGSFNGKVTFLEPMIAYDFIKSNPKFEKDVKQPAKYEESGKYYPTQQGFFYDTSKKEYRFYLSGFLKR